MIRPARQTAASGRIVLTMLEALACRGPDGAGVALIGPEPGPAQTTPGRSALPGANEPPVDRLAPLGRLIPLPDGARARRRSGSIAALSLRSQPGRRVPTISSGPWAPAAAGWKSSAWGAGSTWSSRSARRRSSRPLTPSRPGPARWPSATPGCPPRAGSILSHSQPFWVHGVPDLATVHNGHVTNYHQLRRRYEQQGVIFYTDNDSEVIGVYLRDRMEQGRSLPEALADSVADLDGAFNYLVASPDGLGIVRDRYGFKPLVLAETDDFVAVATEEIALRRALPRRLFRRRAPARLGRLLPDRQERIAD